MTGVAPSAPFAPPAPEPGLAIARAVHGLVDDQYAVVAHTPNLTRDAARELCRAVGVGDPTVPVDDALSFLHVPAWGFVCTRYATERDSRGRLALVSDSVAVDVATFRALRGDPFRCMPRRADLPNGPRELAVPCFTPSTPDAEAARLMEARRAVDEARELRPLLAALLAGERVLYVSPNGPLAPALLQCVVLLLPPSLRGLATFQTVATRAPLHAPRLTSTDRRYAELGTVEWTRELPREAAAGDPRADAAADALLALPAHALAAGQALFEDLTAEGPPRPAVLLDGAERVARYGTLVRALAAGDAATALGTLAAAPAPAPDASEAAHLVQRVLDATSTASLADAFATLLAERGARAYRAGTVLVSELLRREAGSEGASHEAAADQAVAHAALDALLRAADGARWTSDDAARALRGALAVVAARRGDGDRLVQLADADGPWSDVPPPARAASTAETRAALAVVAALAAARSGDAGASAAAIGALGALVPSLAVSGRRDATVLAAAVAGRALAGCVSRPEPAPVQTVADALADFWAHVPPADERDEALRELLAPRPTLRSAADAEPRAADAVKRLTIAGASADELAGWIGAAALRALAAGRGAGAIVAAVDAAGRTESLGRCLGALLLAAAPAGPPLHEGWPALLERVAPAARRELLVRALARATAGGATAGGVTAGDIALDDLAATCGALADLGFQLDDAAAAVVAPPLARWAATLPATRGGAARAGMALDLLGELADASTARTLAATVLGGAPEPLRALVQLRRLATAAVEIDATRDPAAWTAHRAMLRARLTDAADAPLLPGQLAALRELLDVRDTAPARLLGRLWPSRDTGPDASKREGGR